MAVCEQAVLGACTSPRGTRKSDPAQDEKRTGMAGAPKPRRRHLVPLCKTEREVKEEASQEAFPLSPGVLELVRDDQVSALAAFPPRCLTLIDPLIHSTNIYQTCTT